MNGTYRKSKTRIPDISQAHGFEATSRTIDGGRFENHMKPLMRC